VKSHVDRQAIIDYRLQRARETLSDAHLLFEQGGSFWSIINRAYYAMFYAILALLTSSGKGASKHSGVIALFDQHFVKPGHFSKEMSKAIHKVFDLRQMGDYREFVTLEEDQVKEVLDLADGFVDEVERFFHKD